MNNDLARFGLHISSLIYSAITANGMSQSRELIFKQFAALVVPLGSSITLVRVLRADLEGLTAAADVVRNGGLICYPTETVYGLGCDPFDASAIERSMRVKGARTKPMPVLVKDIENETLRPSLGPRNKACTTILARPANVGSSCSGSSPKNSCPVWDDWLAFPEARGLLEPPRPLLGGLSGD